MSPTVFREGPFRYYFFSREESRMHVHVMGPSGEAKIWLEPEIALANAIGLSKQEQTHLIAMVKERADEIRADWHRHFGG
jgi:hypothetical protein